MGITFKTIEGKESSLEDYKGKVVLIVNVASQCGLTPQYEGLEKLYKEYDDKGLVILGFPANEFGAQEPGSNEEISSFCQLNYGVTFPMFEKIVVKGQGQHPLYTYLTKEIPAAQKNPNSTLEEKLKSAGLLSGGPSDIKWNFEKFLIGKNGKPVARFAPDVAPADSLLMDAINKELSK